MRVRLRLRTRMCGPDVNLAPGSVVDFPPEVANALIEGGYAESAGRVAEAATAEPSTTRAVTRKKPRRRVKA